MGSNNKFRGNGTDAEKFFITTYLDSHHLGFEKIKETNTKTPDGYITDRNRRRIALIEVKLVTHGKRESHGPEEEKIHKTIGRQISKAKKQLKQIETNLPKVVYLIGDDPAIESNSLKRALFGEWMSQIYERAGLVFNWYKGFHPVYRKSNKFRDDVLSGVICLVSDGSSFKSIVVENNTFQNLPFELIDNTDIIEHTQYIKGENEIYLNTIQKGTLAVQ